MGTSIHCCLNLPPATSTPRQIPLTKTTSSPWPATCWRRRCVVTAACVVLGSTIGFSAVGEDCVLADDLLVAVESEGKVLRWSDKRNCPPWHVNSLENIMPENLPRPYSRRRSESIGIHQSAPAVGGSFNGTNSNNCYSL